MKSITSGGEKERFMKKEIDSQLLIHDPEKERKEKGTILGT
jgi:hypothetical protein